MFNASSRIARALLSRYYLIRHYYPISDSPLRTALFFSLPSRFAQLQPICRFRIGDIAFYTRRSDLVAVEEVALRGEYDFIRILARQSDPLILDLGANIGMFAVLAFSLFPRAEVHSFEASSDTFRILRMNQQVNSGIYWHTFQEAVWKSEGIVQFEAVGESTTRRIIASEIQTTCEQVRATTLESIIRRCARRISVCKIDIEGAEEAVLASSFETLRLIDNLIVEIHPGICSKERVIRMLKLEFRHLHSVSARDSNKPLLVATRTLFDWPPESHVHEIAC